MPPACDVAGNRLDMTFSPQPMGKGVGGGHQCESKATRRLRGDAFESWTNAQLRRSCLTRCSTLSRPSPPPYQCSAPSAVRTGR
jgi:hypothetical protein